ncbi:putative membrane protein (plasmid) [Sinorhizobium sojae CCBAU 05684]|uniref:Putative membrane protein n=1 Tax=Sinorhizobium sojae CCBAU 05684 TaxID=716928 RepID=A0A249PMI2_9HYPH|nr:putative membrane protein [Sinorhizobium sojae CCBAU 05684]
MPFTEEQFFQVFADYNAAVSPLPAVAYILGLTALGFLFWRNRISTVLIMAVLALMWLVNGVGYHWSFFASINPAARIFGAAFVLQALLLAVAPFVSPDFRLGPAKDARTVVGLALAAYAMVIYPILGWLFGQVYPAVPVFGIAPCPTTIFTIGVLLLGSSRTAWWLLVIPALWGIVGGSAALLIGVPQDYGLIAAFLLVLAFATAYWLGASFARRNVGANSRP